jgi:hypothetical protein
MFPLFLMEPYSICELTEIFYKVTFNIFAALFISILHGVLCIAEYIMHKYCKLPGMLLFASSIPLLYY